MAGKTSVAVYGQSCESLFRRLCDGWEIVTIPGCDISLAAIAKESERFDTWARNIAALQDARLPSSLEHRLRNDQGALGKVKKALIYLEESLKLALSIISGEKENEIWIVSTENESGRPITPNELPKGSEIVELYLSIQDGVTNLFRLSMIIRKKPQVDEYIKAESKFPDMDPLSDIIHVGDRYPKSKTGDLWLRERLGISITRRRQYLLYRKEHQDSMGKERPMQIGPDGRTVWSGEQASTYLPGEETTVLTHESTNHAVSSVQPFDSRTTYADSSLGGEDGSSNLIKTPLLPKDKKDNRVQYGEHFECPYCRRLTIAMDKQQWKKHIMSDLRPYVCTFELCDLRMFESQHEWFEHELQFHRKQWKCQLCPDAISMTRIDIRTHISTTHLATPNFDSDSFMQSCHVPRIDPSSCPLCAEWGSKLRGVDAVGDVSLKQYRQHVGSHMEQLAMAALPQGGDRSDDSESESESDSLNAEYERKRTLAWYDAELKYRAWKWVSENEQPAEKERGGSSNAAGKWFSISQNLKSAKTKAHLRAVLVEAEKWKKELTNLGAAAGQGSQAGTWTNFSIVNSEALERKAIDEATEEDDLDTIAEIVKGKEIEINTITAEIEEWKKWDTIHEEPGRKAFNEALAKHLLQLELEVRRKLENSEDPELGLNKVLLKEVVKMQIKEKKKEPEKIEAKAKLKSRVERVLGNNKPIEARRSISSFSSIELLLAGMDKDPNPSVLEASEEQGKGKKGKAVDESGDAARPTQMGGGEGSYGITKSIYYYWSCCQCTKANGHPNIFCYDCGHKGCPDCNYGEGNEQFS